MNEDKNPYTMTELINLPGYEDRAFGWPTGSVRAALAFMGVGATVLGGLGLTAGLALNGKLTEAMGVFGMVQGLGLSAMAFYFGRGGSTGGR